MWLTLGLRVHLSFANPVVDPDFVLTCCVSCRLRGSLRSATVATFSGWERNLRLGPHNHVLEWFNS